MSGAGIVELVATVFVVNLWLYVFDLLLSAQQKPHMKSKFSLFIFFVLCVCHQATAQLQWVRYEGEQPTNIVMGGQENGADLGVCRAIYNDAFHAGRWLAETVISDGAVCMAL